MKKRILVTGHKGFIGQNMVKMLTKTGYLVEGYDWADDLRPSVAPFDHVVHLGAISSTTCKDVDAVMRQNLEFSLDLLDECELNGVGLTYASSASVYGTLKGWKEDGPCLPLSPYAWSKYLFDREVTRCERNVPVQGLRFFNVYGEHEEHKGNQKSVFHTFKDQAIGDGIIRPFEGSDNFLRDFIYVQDVCRVIERFFDITESGIWNVGTGTARSFSSIAQIIARRYGAKIEERPMPEGLTAQYQQFTESNNEKLSKTLGTIRFSSPEEWVEKWTP